jgi:lysophospholipase L1-like esterase
MNIVIKCILLACLLACVSSSAIGGVFYDDGATTMHFAFEGNPNGDRPIVRPPAFYHADDGFGFVDSPALIGTALGVTAPKYFRFDVNLPDGNYDVAVTLGGTESDSITTVKAEGHRPMLLNVHVAPGGVVTRMFTVNVRHGIVGKAEHDGWLDMDGRLNLEFVGVNPSLMKLDIRPNKTAITVYLAGDSTVCDQDNIPFVGWGQMLPILFKPGEVAVSNRASSGRTAKSFIEEHRLDSIAQTIKAGDYLFVQFATNDMKDHTLDAAKWKALLQVYIDVARKHQATVVLVTAQPRRQFDANGKIRNSLGNFPQWMRELAAEQKVPLIDLNAAATAFFETLGPAGTTKAFVHYPAHTFPTHPEPLADNTHFNPYGAFELAKLVAQGIQEQKLDLASHLTGDVGTNPDPAKFPANLGYDYLLNASNGPTSNSSAR